MNVYITIYMNIAVIISFISVPIKCCCKDNDLTCTKEVALQKLNLLHICYICM